MYRPDDKDIDRLSREAAEHYQAPGSPAWDALRQTLEKELPQEKEKKRRGFLFFFLLLAGLSLAGSGIWYGIHTSTKTTADRIAAAQQGATKEKNNIKQDTPDQATTEKSAAIPSAINPVAGNNAITTEKENSTTAGSKSVPNKPNKSIQGTPVATTVKTPAGNQDKTSNDNVSQTANNKLVNSHNLTLPAIASPANTKRPVTAVNHHITITAKQHTIREKTPRAKDNPLSDQNNLSAVNNKEKTKNAEEIVDNRKDENQPGDKSDVSSTEPAAKPALGPVTTADLAKDSSLTKPAAANKNIDSAKAIAAKSKATVKRDKAILFGLTGGFDFSTVKFTDGSNAGYNIGFMGGYQFNKHWSALTGIVYTKKNYKLNGSDYHPPKHDWVSYVSLQKVDGFCRMWELPILARYVFNPAAKNSFFATAGLSSYFMKKQQYDYYYKNYSGVAMVAPWHNDSTFTHLFSILDLSVGLQKPIGKHMDLLIEPYARLPLGGVGFGNIRLSSFGVNLTVQYKKLLRP